jgi:Acetoacetate decarboxylase
MYNESFKMSTEDIKSSKAAGTPIDTGLILNQEEGMFVSWLTKPEKVEKILPPPLKMLAPIATVYVANIQETNFGPAYLESCLIVPALYNDTPGAYLVSLLLTGPGAQMATYLGRDVYGLPKKFADKINITRMGDSVRAYVERGGVRIIDVELEIGEYNTPDAEEMFGANKPGALVEGDSYFCKFNIDQDETGKFNFSNARLIHNKIKTLYKEWLPCTAKVALQPSANDPWAELEVVQVLGAGYSKYDLHMFYARELAKMDTEEVVPYLLKARYDSDIIGKPTRTF